jgi:hypothetical protein
MSPNGFPSFSRTLLALALTFACAGAAKGDSFQNGAFVTNVQSDWSDITTTAGAALQVDFTSVYAPVGGGLLVGLPTTPGFYMLFGDPDSVQTYLPTVGAPVALSGSFTNPTCALGCPGGDFGGQVVALKLNIDSERTIMVGYSLLPPEEMVVEVEASRSESQFQRPSCT